MGKVEMAVHASEISQLKLSEKIKEERFKKKFPLRSGEAAVLTTR